MEELLLVALAMVSDMRRADALAKAVATAAASEAFWPKFCPWPRRWDIFLFGAVSFN